MKRIIASVLLVFVLVACTSCSQDKTVAYSESGLNFSLPSDMRKLSVDWADVCYGNSDNAMFFVYFYSASQLLTELYIPKDSTVKVYADWFVNANKYENVTESYDEEGKLIVLTYVYEPENTYYCDYITRNEYALYHVTMCCDADLAETYKPIFADWMSFISLQY